MVARQWRVANNIKPPFAAASNNLLEFHNQQSRMHLGRRMKRRVNAEMNLDAVVFEPTAAPFRRLRGFGISGSPNMCP
jgi:hypothetical protein